MICAGCDDDGRNSPNARRKQEKTFRLVYNVYISVFFSIIVALFTIRMTIRGQVLVYERILAGLTRV